MKRVLIFLCVALLSVGVVWAEEVTSEEQETSQEETPMPVDSAPVEGVPFGEVDFSDPGEGGCQVPDLTGLSEEEAKATAIAAGFSVMEQVPAQLPMCPVRSSCPNILNCGVGGPCSASILGPCCQVPGGGLGICCIAGQITVKQCPCVCTGNPCALSCVSSTHVRWGC